MIDVPRNNKAAIINSIISSYISQKPRYITTPTPRFAKTGIGIQTSYGESRKSDWPYRTYKQTMEMKKAWIYNGLQRKIGNASNEWNISYPFLNDTISLTNRHQHRLRIKHHGLISKSKRFETRMYDDLERNHYFTLDIIYTHARAYMYPYIICPFTYKIS